MITELICCGLQSVIMIINVDFLILINFYETVIEFLSNLSLILEKTFQICMVFDNIS